MTSAALLTLAAMLLYQADGMTTAPAHLAGAILAIFAAGLVSGYRSRKV